MTVLNDFLAELAGEEQRWQTRALCAQVDHEMWYPEKGGATKDAKRICGMCPVREECLEYALAREERYGVWGGKSERERRKIMRERRRWAAA